MSARQKYTPTDILALKNRGEKITMVTAFDYPSARLAEQGEVDMILVGDSLSMTVLGYESTKEITLDEMLHHTRAVIRGARQTHIIGDLPAATYDTPEQAYDTAQQFLAAGCDSVKFEGARTDIARILQERRIPAVGHIGLTPQTAEALKVQGKTPAERDRLVQEAQALAAEQVFLLIIECVPAGLGRDITAAVKIPTVGIGAGPGCDGQVLVLNDILGLFDRFKPKFVRQYAEFGRLGSEAVRKYVEDVKTGRFPAPEESYSGA